MSKSGRLLKGKAATYLGNASGMTRHGVYILVRAFLKDGDRWYRVRDRLGNTFQAPSIFFDVK